MGNTVRAALLQTDWPGTKEGMLDKHEQAAHDAAKQGAQVMCFQELFYGPYFCQVQDAEYYGYTEPIPDGPTTQRFQAVAKETGMVLVLPMYEIVQPGLYYNTAAVLERIQRLAAEQVPMLTLYQEDALYGKRKNVNFQGRPDARIPVFDISLR